MQKKTVKNPGFLLRVRSFAHVPFTANCLWLLIQADLLVMTAKEHYSMSTFLKPSLPGTVSFLADSFNTERCNVRRFVHAIHPFGAEGGQVCKLGVPFFGARCVAPAR